jgi:hypothetical protein
MLALDGENRAQSCWERGYREGIPADAFKTNTAIESSPKKSASKQ